MLRILIPEGPELSDARQDDCARIDDGIFVVESHEPNLAALNKTADDPLAIVLTVPELTNDGELPPGVHIASRPEFEFRFGGSAPMHLRLLGLAW